MKDILPKILSTRQRENNKSNISLSNLGSFS